MGFLGGVTGINFITAKMYGLMKSFDSGRIT